MFDFNTLANFSRTNCINICTFLVPANLIATSITIVLVTRVRPSIQVWQIALIGIISALLMLLHVFTWFTVGIVMAPTYILLGIASSCFLSNVVAIAYNYNSIYLEKHY